MAEQLYTLEQLQELAPIFKSKLGSILLRPMIKFVALDKLNRLYMQSQGPVGPDYADAFLRNAGVDYSVGNIENLRELPEGAFITISNHPYGSIDGIAMVDLFGHVREGYKVMVNKILMTCKPLNPNFISVVPNGNTKSAPNATSISGVRAAMQNIVDGEPLGLFPSGAVSDLSLKERCIRDREWQMPIIRLIQKCNVPVVPVRFVDRSSLYYYLLGLIDWKVRLLRLPGEVFNKKGKKVRIVVGKPIMPEELKQHGDLKDLRQFLRDSVYGMELPKEYIHRSEFDPCSYKR